MRFHTSNTERLVHCQLWRISSAANGTAWLRCGDPPEPAPVVVTCLIAHWYKDSPEGMSVGSVDISDLREPHQRGKSIRGKAKKKAPRGTRGVKGGMDMGYRALVRPAVLTARAAMMRNFSEMCGIRLSHNP